MPRGYLANIGLGAFAMVLACSLAILIGGMLSPSYAKPLQVGERMPDFALCDEQGDVHDLDSFGDRSIMLVSPPTAGLSDRQVARVIAIRRELEATVRLHAVAIARGEGEWRNGMSQDICGLVLLDPNQTLWPICGIAEGDAAVCLIDRLGYIRFREDVPADGQAMAAAPANAGLSRHAAAAISGLVMSRK